MDVDRDLFVQAFWAKCRETIRPELDRAVERLAEAGETAAIGSQEVENAGDPPPGAEGSGPSLTLSTDGMGLCFYADVSRQTVMAGPAAHGQCLPGERSARHYNLDELDPAEVATIVAAWEAGRCGEPRIKPPSLGELT